VNSFADVFWAMIMFYFVFMIIWIFIRIFADIFRRQDLTGLMKVVWIIVLFWIPFFGAMIYLIARPRLPMDAEDAAPAAQTATPQTAAVAAPQTAAVAASSADEIAKLAALRDSGAITPAEFDAAKAKALA
jgi:zona occludens toxin (predicted ATPase)